MEKIELITPLKEYKYDIEIYGTDRYIEDLDTHDIEEIEQVENSIKEWKKVRYEEIVININIKKTRFYNKGLGRGILVIGNNIYAFNI